MANWIIPECYTHAFELVCCFFTVLAAFASYLFSIRI